MMKFVYSYSYSYSLIQVPCVIDNTGIDNKIIYTEMCKSQNHMFTIDSHFSRKGFGNIKSRGPASISGFSD